MDFRNERTWQNAVEVGKTDEFHAAYQAAIGQVRSEFGAKHPMIIGGEEVWATATFPDTSPADTTLVLGHFQKGTRAHTKQAIRAAKDAFPSWSATPYPERVRIAQAAADLIRDRKFPYAALMSFENGKNRLEAMADVDEAADLMRWYAAEMLRNQGFERPMGQYLPGETARSVLKPYGVWAVVAPFNFPLAIAAGMSTGALVTANADLDKAAVGVMRAAFGYGGQKCSACSRVLVDRKVKAAFLEKLVSETRKIKTGDPTDRDVYLGPLINDEAVDKYENAVGEVKRA